MKKIAVLVMLSVILVSCTTMPNKYSQNNNTISKKIAALNYEMARNIILHKDYTNLSQAFNYLNKAISLSPNDAKLYYMKALAYQLRHNDNETFNYLKKCIAQDQKFYDCTNALGIYYFKQHQYKKAEESFGKIIDDPTYSHTDIAFFNRAKVYEKKNEINKATSDAESALMFSNYSNKVYWQYLINLNIKQKHYINALKNLFSMEKYAGKSDYTHYAKALIYTNLSMYDKAKDELKQISKDNTEYGLAKEKLLKRIARHDSNANN